MPESTALFFVVEMYVGGKQEIVKGKEVLGGLCELWLLSGSSFFMTNNFEGHHDLSGHREQKVAEQPARAAHFYFSISRFSIR